MPAEILHESFNTERFIPDILDHGYGAHALPVVMLVQIDNNIRPAALSDGNHTICLRPMSNTFVDKSKD
ncbi:hypothetical protein D3C85_1797660 [compost metagenome]